MISTAAYLREAPRGSIPSLAGYNFSTSVPALNSSPPEDLNVPSIQDLLERLNKPFIRCTVDKNNNNDKLALSEKVDNISLALSSNGDTNDYKQNAAISSTKKLITELITGKNLYNQSLQTSTEKLSLTKEHNKRKLNSDSNHLKGWADTPTLQSLCKGTKSGNPSIVLPEGVVRSGRDQRVNGLRSSLNDNAKSLNYMRSTVNDNAESLEK
jgi:hypothetical protein